MSPRMFQLTIFRWFGGICTFVGRFSVSLLLRPVLTFDKASIQETCNRIISYSTVGIPFNGQTLKIGSSVGVALYPNDGQSEESLYKASDMALYLAKRRRSNYSFVAPAAAE
jgi:predicted signal transduction protein with EAL and GGDEF domain